MKPFALLLLSLLASTAAKAEDIKLLTEDYAPMNFQKDGEIIGGSVEQVKLMMKRAGLTYTLELMPWARGFSLASGDEPYCLFSTAHTAERDPHFKWIEPLAVTSSVLIAKSGSNIHPKSIKDAWQYTVGTQRADVTADLLRQAGFPKVDLAVNFDMTVKKLLAGRIDLMIASDGYFRETKAKGADIEIAYVLSKQVNSIACGLKTPDEVVAKMQASLNSLIKDGTQKAILDKYGMSDK
jgi:polar amino acid transport system substrate-binding protein